MVLLENAFLQTVLLIINNLDSCKTPLAGRSKTTFDLLKYFFDLYSERFALTAFFAWTKLAEGKQTNLIIYEEYQEVC